MTLSAKTNNQPDNSGRPGVVARESRYSLPGPRRSAALVGLSATALLAAGHFAWAALLGSTATSDLPGGNNPTRSIAVGDLNCDTIPDVIVANEDGEANQILWGVGDGTFQNPINLTDVPNNVFTDNSDSVDLADIDQDGDLDILIGNAASSVPNRLYENVNPCGTFNYLGSNAIGTTFTPRRTADAQFGDVNGDGDPDVVIANRGAMNLVFLGGNGPGFPISDNLPNSGATDSSSVAIGDLNGDTRPEVVIGNRENALNDVYINNGNVNSVPYSNRFDLSPDLNYTDWVAIADLNNDGWNDVVIANRDQPNQYLLNNQSGVNSDLFGPTQSISDEADYTREIRVIDVDNDGDIDVITANDSEAFNKVYLNQFIQTGAVVFSDGIAYTMDTLETTSLDVCDPNGTPACDLDGDADIDVVTANNANQLNGITTAPNQVHINNNEAPEIISTPITGAGANVLYEYTIVAADADFDQALTVTAVTAPAWLTSLVPDPNDDRRATASGTPTVAGDYDVSITVSDGNLDATQSFTITVSGGTPPVLAAIGDPLAVT